MPGLTPRLPLNLAPKDGYDLIKTTPELIKQNLKNLLLTNPGERIMDPSFGVGIRRYLFEPNIIHTHQLIRTEIGKQVKKYMPFLNIKDVRILQDESDGNIMYVEIYYIISPLNQTDSITVEARR